MRVSTILHLVPFVLAAVVGQAQRITMPEFLAKMPLPVDFESEKVDWLLRKGPVILEDVRIIDAIDKEDRSVLRDILACPICSKCMHSSTLVTTRCGHGFHAECFARHVEEKGRFCPKCRDEGPHDDLWKRTLLREALGIFDDEEWIPANPRRKKDRVTLREFSQLDALPITFHSSEMEWLLKQKTVVASDTELIDAVKKQDAEALYQMTPCSICTDVLHSSTLMTTLCGHVFHVKCFSKLSRGACNAPCPLCRNRGPHEVHWQGTLFKDALRLFKDEGWIPVKQQLITEREFLDRKPLPVDFASKHLRLLANEKATVAYDNEVLDAIKYKDPALLRDLVACPICSKPMHFETFVVTSCGHVVHGECLNMYEDNIGDMCPVCNKGGPLNAHRNAIFLSDTLQLFDDLGWIPFEPEKRMTMKQFETGTPVPVDFESKKLKWLVGRNVMFGAEWQLLEAINAKNPADVRNAVTCKICKKCIHSASLRMTTCGHAFHMQCIDKKFVVAFPCPVCRTILDEASESTGAIVSQATMFSQALYLFEFENWIPVREPDMYSRSNPFEHRREDLVPPNDWFRDLLPTERWKLPVESPITRDFRLFVRDRFFMHIKIFRRVMNEIANALDICRRAYFLKSITNEYKYKHAIPHAMCYLAPKVLAKLDSKLLMTTPRELADHFRSYGAPFRSVVEKGRTVLYVGENKNERPFLSRNTVSFKNRGLLIKNLFPINKLLKSVTPVLPGIKIAKFQHPSEEESRGANPDAVYPVFVAKWLGSTAAELGHFNYALVNGVALIFHDVRPDWMRKAYEWLQNMNAIISLLLKFTIKKRSENMVAFQEHYTILQELITKPPLAPGDLAAWQEKGTLQEMEKRFSELDEERIRTRQ